VSSDYIFEKILPSFSITFYKTFNNNIFSDRFDSYKDVQIISTVNAENEAQNNVFVYAK
jgi:hypothetical protein